MITLAGCSLDVLPSKEGRETNLLYPHSHSYLVKPDVLSLHGEIIFSAIMQTLCIQPGRKLCQEGRDMGVRGLEAKQKIAQAHELQSNEVRAIVDFGPQGVTVYGSEIIAKKIAEMELPLDFGVEHFDFSQLPSVMTGAVISEQEFIQGPTGRVKERQVIVVVSARNELRQ